MIITSPETFDRDCLCLIPGHSKLVFLAGGITGAPDWQKPFGEAIDSPNWIIFNPRRKMDIPWGDTPETHQQVEWEYKFLNQSDIIVFWFPKEAKCMITLFELGKELGKFSSGNYKKKLYVGVEDGYLREFDVRKQVRLTDPKFRIYSSLRDMANSINSLKVA